MISKNSFWASLQENNKRRIWLWILSSLFFFFFYPVATALIISQFNEYQQFETAEIAEWMLLSDVGKMLGFNPVFCIFATIIAIGCAIQGYSYLYKKKKVDLYHSLPVSKARRFSIIWLNGVLIYVIPCFIGLCLGLIVAAIQGVNTVSLLSSIFMAYVYNLIFYISIYNLAILAVMMTGHLMITIFSILVFLLYEFLVRGLIYFYQETFFDKFSMNTQLVMPFLSSFRIYFEGFEILGEGNLLALFPHMIQMLIFGAVLGGIAYLCYWKRPAEAAGRAMTFSMTRPIIKVGITVPVALFAALMMKEMTPGAGSQGFVIFAIIVSVILVCCLLEVIFEFDIKASLHHKKYILITGFLTAAIYIFFRLDLIGYDAYIPKPEQIKNYALILSGSYGYGFDEELQYQNLSEYASENMFVTDADAICELARMQPEEYGKDIHDATVEYRLKNGRTVYREVLLDYADNKTAEMLNRIIGSPEFKKGYFIAEADYFGAKESGSGRPIKTEVTFKKGAYNLRLPKESIEKVIELYRKDLETAQFTDFRDELPVGALEFTFIMGASKNDVYNANRTQYSLLEVYPSFTQTISYLKENGLYKENYVDIEDIEKIEVVHYSTAEGDIDVSNYYYQGFGRHYYVESADRDIETVTKAFGDEEELKQIINAVYPYDGQLTSWSLEDTFMDGYSVTIYFKRGSDVYNSYASALSCSMKTGKIPAFVEEATAFQEQATEE